MKTGQWPREGHSGWVGASLIVMNWLMAWQQAYCVQLYLFEVKVVGDILKIEGSRVHVSATCWCATSSAPANAFITLTAGMPSSTSALLLTRHTDAHTQIHTSTNSLFLTHTAWQE